MIDPNLGRLGTVVDGLGWDGDDRVTLTDGDGMVQGSEKSL
jgi:hypothetical protein